MLIILVFAGCATMDDLRTSVTSKVASITSDVDPNLVAKVPDDKRGDFPKVEFAVKVAEEKLKLAQMKTEAAAKQKKVVEYEEDLVHIDLKDAGLDFDIVKMGAVNASGLGKKEDNSKVLTNLKLKKVDLQGDRIKTDANIATVKQQISDLSEKIKAQTEMIKGLTEVKAKPEEGTPAPVEMTTVEKPPAIPTTPAVPLEKAKE
jgi:hypothetical protein